VNIYIRWSCDEEPDPQPTDVNKCPLYQVAWGKVLGEVKGFKKQ